MTSKQELYENIMNRVARTVKRTLDEASDSVYDKMDLTDRLKKIFDKLDQDELNLIVSLLVEGKFEYYTLKELKQPILAAIGL